MHKQKAMSPKKTNHPQTTDELLRALPSKMYHHFRKEDRYAFSLMMIPESDGEKWTARYYSLANKIMNSSIPIAKGKSVNSVLKKMYDHFRKNIPEELNKKWEK